MTRFCLTCWLVTIAFAAGAEGLSLDLATARFRTTGLSQHEGGTVLAGGAQVGEYLRIADSNVYPVVVWAAAKPVAGYWPQLALLVDGLPIQTVTVDSEEPRDYTLSANFTAGMHQLSLALVNPVQGAAGLGVLVRSARLEAPEGAAAPVLAELKEWRAEARRREAAALAHADEVIERLRKADAVVRVVDGVGRPLAGVSVHIAQQRHAFLFGCNLFQLNRLPSGENEAYAKAFADVFNYATIPFYWAYEQDLGGAPRQRLVDFCRAHDLEIKGHPLMWNTPYGWPDGATPPDEASQQQRVQEVLRQWSAGVAWWDVLNEPVTAPGVRLAVFRWAREVSASARLLINESGVLSYGSPPFLQLLRHSLREGEPIDAVGIQAHEPAGMRYPLDQVSAVLDRFAELGKPLHISEVAIPSAGQAIIGSYMAGTWDEQRQANYATEFYRLCFGHPGVTAISWWDLADRGAWHDGAGLLRQDMSAKPAYEALRKLIRQQWWTQVTLQTGGDGCVAFRGFLGDYRLQATVGGQVVALDAELRAGAENQWDLRFDAPPATHPAATLPTTGR